jgi:ribosomal protein S18 acetylase RimI-like enzyme
MNKIYYRESTPKDITSLARIRSINSGSEEYWQNRISGYLNGTHHPQQALGPRIIYVAVTDGEVCGFIAGHLTTRHGCDGELQWIDVLERYRRVGVASQLLRVLAKWLVANGAAKVCVDVGNALARRFYSSNGAEDLDENWMIWNDIGKILP